MPNEAASKVDIASKSRSLGFSPAGFEALLASAMKYTAARTEEIPTNGHNLNLRVLLGGFIAFWPHGLIELLAPRDLFALCAGRAFLRRSGRAGPGAIREAAPSRRCLAVGV